MILMRGYLTYSYWGLGSNIIHKAGAGHFRIFKKDYMKNSENDPANYVLEKDEYEKITAYLKKKKEVKVVSPIIKLNGLVTNGITSTSFVAWGFIPELYGQIRYSDPDKYSSGEELDPDKPFSVAIGSGMSKLLKVPVNESLTIYSPTLEGMQNAIDINIIGVIKLKGFLGNMLVEMPLPAAQKLLATDSVGQLAVGMNEDQSDYLQWYDDDIRDFIAEIKPDIEKIYPEAEIVSWMELAPSYKAVKALYDTTYLIITIILVCLVILSIANVQLMSVMERTREVGTMRAMGFSRLQVGIIFTLEGFWMGLFGSMAAAVLGFIGGIILNLFGIQWTPPGSDAPVPVQVMIQFSDLIQIGALLLMFATLSSGIALYRAFKLSIAESLRVK